ncbi:MAG: VanZ family protein [Candidatus Rokuibacteriota bacterium]
MRLLPPLAWTALIAWFATDRGGAPVTGGAFAAVILWILPDLPPDTVDALHGLARKFGHVTEYSVLVILWARSFGGWRVPLALTVATAFLDELAQAATLTRTGSAADVALDAASAGAAVALFRGGAATLARVTTALLWVAAVGGSALFLLDLAAGAQARWLWLSVPAAWLVIAVRRRAEIRRRA